MAEQAIAGDRKPFCESPLERIAGMKSVIEEGGDAPKLTEAGMPTVRMWFLNRSEFQILDTWDVAGLRGSGSHDVLADGALVPERFVPVELVTQPALYSNPVFRVPVPLRLAYNKAAMAIGVARGALDTFADLAQSKIPMLSSSTLRDAHGCATHRWVSHPLYQDLGKIFLGHEPDPEFAGEGDPMSGK